MTGCNGCEARWGGLSTAHCAACHVTFTVASNFDKHRRDGKCLAPSSAGLVDAGREYACFGMPGDTQRWSE